MDSSFAFPIKTFPTTGNSPLDEYHILTPADETSDEPLNSLRELRGSSEVSSSEVNEMNFGLGDTADDS